MTKKNKTPLGIFIESIGLYFSNIGQFTKYMTFPVMGQILGMLIVFTCTYIYSKNLPVLIDKYSFFNNFNTLIFMSILVALPGMIILVKAFWEYLVAYGAINSMLENMLKSGKVYDFDAHTELIKRRTPAFLGLWFLFGVFSVLALIPIFWVPAGVLAVFFVLIFQVFTYEPELSPIGCAKKSLILVKGHFASTFMLMALAGALTYMLVPEVLNNVLKLCGITGWISGLAVPIIDTLPISELNAVLANFFITELKVYDIALFTVTTFIAQIVIQYTLPLRSILWCMWYRELNGSLPKIEKKKKSAKTKNNTTSKKPSEILMEETNKKFGRNKEIKKIDNNLLKRAMEKEDE